jgi:hypothetical protein
VERVEDAVGGDQERQVLLVDPGVYRVSKVSLVCSSSTTKPFSPSPDI